VAGVDDPPDPLSVLEALETRGHTPTQRRLRRGFLRFIPVGDGEEVLEVGCGTGVVARDLLTMVGRRGQVVGLDRSRMAVRAARALSRQHPLRSRLALRVGDGLRLPFRSSRFDVALAITVVLHTAEPLALVGELARVVRRGGRVALQDQDFGTVVAEHPDRALTTTILGDVAAHVCAEPQSGRRLPRLLREAGLGDVRVRVDVYADTTLEPYTQAFLERRAASAVRLGVVEAEVAQHWLDGFAALAERGAFLFTLNYYGAVGTRP
jgi:SAM-dependent methyltransferase